MKLLNEILGTKYPIIQGGMANIATGEFAAACSNAGALGIIGAGGMNADTQMCIRDRFGNLDEALQRQLRSLARMNGRQLAEQRYQKFRQIGEMRKA